MSDGRFYWLKLKRDFFKRHDIRIVEEMPNGKEYILFYLKLLCESVDHDGNLRFSDEIPYNTEMLATITETNLDIVRSAVKLFTDLHMMEKLDDGTIYMREVAGMIGSATDNDNANRQRRYRERQKALENSTDVTPPLLERYEAVTNNNESKSKSKSKRQSKSIWRFTPPTLTEVEQYCKERHNNVDAQRFIDYYTANGWVQGRGKPIKDWKACVRTWERATPKTHIVEPMPKMFTEPYEEEQADPEKSRELQEKIKQLQEQMK